MKFKINLISFLLTSASFATTTTQAISKSEKEISTPLVLAKMEGLLWVKECLKKHPEILWLADGQTRFTQEGSASSNGSYSEQIFGQKFIEFDRTLMTLQCLKWFLNGSDEAYEAFSQEQPESVRLSRHSFQILHEKGIALLNSGWHGLSEIEMAQALESALVLGDMGKSKLARSHFQEWNLNTPDHDDFYEEAIQVLQKNPQLCHSFANLPKKAQNLLVTVANTAHYGHITHLEGGVNMLAKLRESHLAASDPIALDFDLFVHNCDVAGGAGHVSHHSSLNYTELTAIALRSMEEGVKILSDESKTAMDAYLAYLSIRAQFLDVDIDNAKGRILARLGAMLRLFTKEEGEFLKEGMDLLTAEELDLVLPQWDLTLHGELPRTPTYIPAVLLNLSNNKDLGNTRQERIIQTIKIGLPTISKVLQKQRVLLANKEADPAIPLNFNEMAGIAKNAPHTLSTTEFGVASDGQVLPIDALFESSKN